MNQVPNALAGALRELGLGPNDDVLIHSDSSLAMELSGADWWDDAFEYQVTAIREVIGTDGTLLVPTFNYDFCEGKPYSETKSRSQVGMFTNYVLDMPAALRSFHPIFSFAALGARSGDLLTTRSNSSFGDGSVFENLYDADAKLLFLNVSFEFCTFVHFAEQRIGVDYRYLKDFTGQVTQNGQTREDTFDFYVRYLDRTVDTYFGRLERALRESGHMRSVLIAGEELLLTSTRAVYDTAAELLSRDRYSLLKQPPVMQ